MPFLGEAVGVISERCGFPPKWNSQRFDGRFRLQQDRNPIAYGIHALALVTLQGVFPAQHQGFAAYRAGKYLQQVRIHHSR